MGSTPPRPVAIRRARLAGLVSSRQPEERINAAREDLRAAVAEQRIRDIVASAPPLTGEQRARLAALLAAAPAVADSEHVTNLPVPADAGDAGAA